MFWQIVITLIGSALILIAVSNLTLYFLGESTAATVKTRRVGGSDDGRPVNERYKWAIDYTFYDKDGAEYIGHTSRRGSDFSVNIDRRVYYFSFAPFISAPESEARPNIGQLLFILIGIFLIFSMKPKKKKIRSVSAVKNVRELTDYDDSVEELFHEKDE